MTNAPGTPSSVGPFLSPAPKDVISTGLGTGRVWATLGQGILTEVYWPSTGEPQTRDLGFFVAGSGSAYEVKAVGAYDARVADPSVPLAVVTHAGPPAHPYTLTIEAVPDPTRDVLLVAVRLRCDDPTARVYPFLASRLHRHPSVGAEADYGAGGDNVAWSEPGGALFAAGAGRVLCLAGEPAFALTSVDVFGMSDLWHDFDSNGRMAWTYTNAGPGFVVLAGEGPSDGVLALALPRTPAPRQRWRRQA